jgi:DNA-binding LacI/PurR family transcriptional regulator
MATSQVPVTIYTVAERAGVSISTVSLAINHPHRVSEKTRRKVIQTVGELGYQPGDTPSKRARTRHGRIAVIAPFTSYPSYSLRIGGVLRAMQSEGLDVVINDLESAAASTSPLLDALPVRGSVDGIIIMGLPLSEEGIRRLVDWGPPVVLVDTHEHEFASVLLDDDRGGYLIGRHLAELGHTRVAFVHEAQKSFEYISAGMLRMTGLRRALAEAGHPDAVVQFEVSDGSLHSGRSAIDRMLASGSGITAVFANHDLLAAGVLAGLRDSGLRAPTDLAVAGFDDGPIAEALGLTTIRQPFVDSGRVAAELLLELIADPRRRLQRVTLTGELVVRSSTAGPRIR